MSGIEVVGLVLGALPLVLEGLKLYHEGAKSARRYLRYKWELKNLHRRIGVAYDIFLNTCGELLEGILTPEGVEPLLSDPSGGQWKSPELKKRLQKRLGRSYDGYMETMLSIHTSVEGIMRKMKLDDQGNVSS